jgi:hypothetical protein
MVRINENLIINESYIVKAEFSKNDQVQTLTLFFAVRTANADNALFEHVLEGREAYAFWEYLLSKANRC